VYKRQAFSFAGISLLIFWSLPLDSLDFVELPDFNAGPEMFVLSGVMMVAGAVWALVYNSDILLGLVTRLLSPFGSLLPVVRIAIAYPMSSKFRTGLTIAMFALVIFMLAFMSVFVNMINEAIDKETASDALDHHIRISVLRAKPIPDLETAIAAAPELRAEDFVNIERGGADFFPDGSGNDFDIYRIKLADGADDGEIARTLESVFVEHALVTEVLEEEIQAARSMMNSIFNLMQAFMGLGLIVGSASIGIVSTRAVATSPGSGFSFSIPWDTLGIVAVIAYAVSMLTTWLPSWQAAHIYPAEALRYE